MPSGLTISESLSVSEMFEIMDILSKNTDSFRIYLDRATGDHFHGHHTVRAPDYCNSLLMGLSTCGSPHPTRRWDDPIKILSPIISLLSLKSSRSEQKSSLPRGLQRSEA